VAGTSCIKEAKKLQPLASDSQDPKATAKITLNRTKGNRDGMRDYVVRLDGQIFGRIAEDQTVSFEVSPGAHNLQVTLDWANSPVLELAVAENQTVQIYCHPGPHGPLSVFLMPGQYLALQMDPPIERYEPPRLVLRFVWAVVGAILLSVIMIIALGYAGFSPSVIGGVVTATSLMWMLVCALTNIPLHWVRQHHP